MKRIGKNGNRLLRILVNEIGAVNKELLDNFKEENKIEGTFFEISLIEGSSDLEKDYLYFSGTGVELNVSLDSIQFIAPFLKEVIQEVLINGNQYFASILCRHFSIFNSLDSLDHKFFYEYVGGCRLRDIYQSNNEYILTFVKERTVRIDFYFPCSSNGDNYIKVRVYIKGEPSNTLKIISPNKEEISTTLMEFIKNEIYRKK